MNRALLTALLACLPALTQEAAPEKAAPEAKPAPKAAHPLSVGRPFIACSDTKLYHRHTCKWAKEIKGGDTCREFTWKAEAQQAGYKPCDECLAPKAHPAKPHTPKDRKASAQ